MIIKKKDVVEKMVDYLNHKISLTDIVDWAESAMMESDFEQPDSELIRNAVAQLGLADVREFGLTWEECEKILTRLGYRPAIAVTEIE